MSHSLEQKRKKAEALQQANEHRNVGVDGDMIARRKEAEETYNIPSPSPKNPEDMPSVKEAYHSNDRKTRFA